MCNCRIWDFQNLKKPLFFLMLHVIKCVTVASSKVANATVTHFETPQESQMRQLDTFIQPPRCLAGWAGLGWLVWLGWEGRGRLVFLASLPWRRQASQGV